MPCITFLRVFCIMEEIWKEVKGFEGLYEVSNYGNVKSLRMNRNLVPILKTTGYLQVGLAKYGVVKRTTIHLIVVGSFLNHKPNGYKIVVNHIDLDKTNNKLGNLEIVPARTNCNLKHVPHTSRYTGVHWHNRDKKWRAQIYINSKVKWLGHFNTEIEASNAYEKYIKENV